ncbi:RECQ4 helicase, partial [Mohoua ochrocephala]|nr:RECQ4 helicase [Mohoua ochrocephala]
GRDLPELRRHIHGDSVDFWAVKKLIQRVFPPCKCLEIHGKIRDATESENREKPRICHGHERSIPIQEMVEALDIREEGIETLLCYLELHPENWLELFPPTYSRCRIRCSGGSRQLREAARSCPPLAVFLARERSAGRDPSGSVEFDVVSLSDSMGWESPLVKRDLRRLQWNSQKGGGKSGILVEFLELSFHFRAYGDLDSQELDSVCEFLHGRVVSREKAALRQLRSCFRAFQSVAFPSCHPKPPENEELERSSRLKELIQEYFQRDQPASDEEEDEDEEEKNLGMTQVSEFIPGFGMRMRRRSKGMRIPTFSLRQLKDWEGQIRADIRNFLSAHPDEAFSGRAIARIFHGIGSPRFPAWIYGRDRRFWRRHLPVEFRELSRLATEEILAWK